jgi:hypothetical protein
MATARPPPGPTRTTRQDARSRPTPSRCTIGGGTTPSRTEQGDGMPMSAFMIGLPLIARAGGSPPGGSFAMHPGMIV